MKRSPFPTTHCAPRWLQSSVSRWTIKPHLPQQLGKVPTAEMEFSSKPHISIRFATLRDIPTVTEIYTSAMCEDEVFNYICCYRDAFHDEHIFYYSQKLKRLLFESRTAFMVAELQLERLDSEKEPPKRVISFAIWSLKGVHLQRNLTWQDIILRKVMRK